ncbi:unnamed protein product [Rhizophagus irregularis]|nr:unnamed protein product [Rhizophagus irregularis]
MILEKSCNANNKKTKTISGISKWFVWDWPITGEAADIQKSFEHDETQNSLNPTSGQMGVDADFPLKPDRYTAEKMHESLLELVREKKLSVEDIPEVKTIKGWIGRYSASSKKEMSEKALEQNAIEENNFVARQEEIDTESTTHSRAKKRQKRS